MHDVISILDGTSYDKIESNVHIPVLLNILNLLQNWWSAPQMLHFIIFRQLV